MNLLVDDQPVRAFEAGCSPCLLQTFISAIRSRVVARQALLALHPPFGVSLSLCIIETRHKVCCFREMHLDTTYLYTSSDHVRYVSRVCTYAKRSCAHLRLSQSKLGLCDAEGWR